MKKNVLIIIGLFLITSCTEEGETFGIEVLDHKKSEESDTQTQTQTQTQKSPNVNDNLLPK